MPKQKPKLLILRGGLCPGNQLQSFAVKHFMLSVGNQQSIHCNSLPTANLLPVSQFASFSIICAQKKGYGKAKDDAAVIQETVLFKLLYKLPSTLETWASGYTFLVETQVHVHQSFNMA